MKEIMHTLINSIKEGVHQTFLTVNIQIKIQKCAENPNPSISLYLQRIKYAINN